MKKVLSTLIIITLISCSSGLEKKYENSTKETDLNQISELISKQDFEILKEHVNKLEHNDSNKLKGKTYQTILTEAIDANYIKQQKIEEESRKEEERIEKEKQQKIIEQKTKLLCSGKWIMKEYAFQIKVPDESEENIELAKDILRKSMFIKDSKLSYDVEKNSKGIFVKGIFEDKLKKIFTGNNMRWKKYSEDGTYTEQFGKESIKGMWEFISENEIKETRPSESSIRRNKKEFYNLEINILDNQTFSFNEKEIDYLNTDSVVSTSIVMKQ